MSGTKWALLTLLLLGLVFVVILIARPAQPKPTLGASSSQPDLSPYPWLGGMNQVLAAFSPNIGAKQLVPALDSFDLSRASSFSVIVVADASHTMRQAKFHIQPAQGKRCARLIYNSFGQAPDGMKGPNDSRDAKPALYEISFVVFSAGGTLAISREPGSPVPCTVSLE